MKLFTKLFLTFALLCFANVVFATEDDTLPLDIQFGPGYNDTSVQTYTDTWTATKDGKTWTITNFNNNKNGWNSIKCGRKNNASVATIASPAINAVVTNYVVTVAKASNVNSAKLTIKNGEEQVGEDIDITENFVAGDVNVPVETQKGYSYILTIDNASASANGSVEITKIALYGEGQYSDVHIENTAETAYTVAKAFELIDAGQALNETVFVKGIISKIDSVNTDLGFITYWISDNGSTEGQQLECYKGKTIEGVALADIEVGAQVIVTGNLKKYGQIYEFDANNTIAAYVAPVKPLFADGKYYIYNKGIQKYLAAGANWGTHAVVNADGLDYDIVFADGKYTINSQVSNGGTNYFLNGSAADGPWNDGGAYGWTINEVSEGVYTISNGTKFIAAGDNDVVTLVDEATSEAAQWTFVAAADRDAANIASLAAATAENGVDATFFIKGANFNRNDLRNNAWTHTKNGGNETFAGPSENRNTYGCEYWNNTFEVSQTITNLPEGVYEFSIAGFATNGTAKLFANETEADFANTSANGKDFRGVLDAIAAGEFTGNTTGKVMVIDGNALKIGVKRTVNQAADWTAFDNARLTYWGAIPAEAFKPAYEDALAAAQAALTNEDYTAVTGSERTALAKAIEDYTTVEETADAYKAAIAALTAATTTFTGAKGAYTALANAKAEMAEVSYPYAAAAKKSAAEAALNATAASAEDATAKTAAIETAFRQYAESSALLEGTFGAVNVTDSIVNPNAQEDIAEPWIVVKGEGSGGSLKVLDGEPLTDGEGNSAYKYFDGGDWGANAWDVALEQTIDLPAGKYYLTAAGRASADVELTLFAGENTAKIAAVGAQGALFGRGWSDASVEFEMAEAGDITIGVRGVTSVVQNWMSFTRFRLVKFGEPGEDAAEITVPEGMENLIENGNLAGESVVSFVAKEAPASAPSPAKIVAMAGKDLSRGIVVKSADNPSQAWDTQFWINLKQELPVGAKLHVEFDYAANKTAKVTTQTHAAPGSYKGGFGPEMSFTTEWKNFSLDYDVTAAGIQSIAFNLAEEKTATEYYFDNFGVWAEMPAEVTWKDIIVNGDMEGDDPTCFFVTEQGVGGPFVATITDGIGKDNSKAVKVQSADSPTNNWDTQFFIRLPYQLPAGTRYKLSFDYKADKAGDFESQSHAEPGQYIHWAAVGSGSFSTEWQTYTTEGAIPSECDGTQADGGFLKIFQTIAFNLALNKTATQFIFDNVKFEVDETIIETLVKNPYCAADAKLAEAPEGWTNLITNGNLANEDVTSFVAKEAPSSDIVGARIVAGAGKDYSHGIQVVAPAKVKDAWESQFWIKVSEPLVEGTKLHVEFDYKADKAASAETQAHAAPGGYQHWAAIGTVNFTTEWQHYTADVDITAAMAKGNDGNGTGTGVMSIAFNLSQADKDVVYSFDNFGVWSQVPVIDGINTAKTDKNAEGVYNLNGQKVMKAQKGLYIINGKKVVK